MQRTTVWVEPPEVSGETVRFRWWQSAPNRFQRVNEFFFRFEALDLAMFSTDLFTEMFLALQLKVFAAFKEPVELVFSDPVPAPSAAYWRAFHGADLVEIGPIADVASYQPLARCPEAPARPIASAVFFGGGKDSTLDAAMFAEMFGPNQVLLIQFIGPLGPGQERLERLERRQTDLMLRPVGACLGVETQRVWTDYQASFIPEGYSARPHLELYTAGALPVIAARAIRFSTFGSTRLDHAILPLANGARHYLRPRSRPETLATQSTHYQRTLGLDHTLTNANFAFSTFMDFHLLHARYPELLPLTVMCARARPDERWCHDCGKCRDFALYGLACGHVDPRFDYDRFLSRGEPIRRMVAFAQNETEMSEHGNLRWREGLMHPSVFAAVCHSLALTEPGLVRARIGAQASEHLRLLIEHFGNQRFASQETVATEIFDFMGVDCLHRIKSIASEHCPTTFTLPAPDLYGDRNAIIDYRTRMPTRTALVPHISQAAPPG